MGARVKESEFMHLPYEIVMSIFKHLTPAELELHAATTCSKLFTLAHDSIYWKEICFTDVIMKNIYDPLMEKHLIIVLEHSNLLHTLKIPKKLLLNANEIYKAVAKNCPKMRIFHLPYFVVTRGVLHELVSKCPLIESIEFSTNYLYNLGELALLQNISYFRIRHCGPSYTTQCTDFCDIMHFVLHNCKKIKDIHVEGFYVDAEVLPGIANLLEDRLNSLTIMFSTITSIGLINLQQKCTKLTGLAISINLLYAINELEAIKKMICLRHLKLHCGGDDQFTMRNALHENKALVGLESLKVSFISFPHTDELGDDVDLLNIGNSCPNLKRLSLKGFLCATNDGINTLFASCRHLEYLKFDKLGSQVTEKCLENLQLKLPLLKCIKIKRCESIASTIEFNGNIKCFFIH